MINPDFSLFEQAILQYESTRALTKNVTQDVCNAISTYAKSQGTVPPCLHVQTITEVDVVTCADCGENIKRNIAHDQEWRYYGSSDHRRGKDPNRVQVRKEEIKSIHKDVETMDFSESIVSQADRLYTIATKGQIYRGISRKAVIFGCILEAYKLSKKELLPDDLLPIFNLNMKNALKGMKIVNMNLPRDLKAQTLKHPSVSHIKSSMDKFSASAQQKQEVVDLYYRIENRSSKLNRARDKSVAAAVIYYWICHKGMDITIREFAKTIGLSELTIQRNAKEVELVLDTPGVVV